MFDGGGGQKFAPDFASKRIDRDRHILNMDQNALRFAWEQCVSNAMKAKVAVEEEMTKARRDHVGFFFAYLFLPEFSLQTDHVKRTHDYEPFFIKYLECLKDEGLLTALLAKN